MGACVVWGLEEFIQWTIYFFLIYLLHAPLLKSRLVSEQLTMVRGLRDSEIAEITINVTKANKLKKEDSIIIAFRVGTAVRQAMGKVD